MNFNFQQLFASKQFASGILADGNPVTVSMSGRPAGSVVWVLPSGGVGDAITVSHSSDGGNTFTPWAQGECTQPAADVLADTTISHLKFQRTAGGGNQSRWGILQDVVSGPWVSQQGAVKVLAVEP